MPSGVIVWPACARSSASVRGRSSGGGSMPHALDGVARRRLGEDAPATRSCSCTRVSDSDRSARCPRCAWLASRVSAVPRIAAATRPPMPRTRRGTSSNTTTMTIAPATANPTRPSWRAESRRGGSTSEVVVDQAARLHQRVADRGADEAEAAAASASLLMRSDAGVVAGTSPIAGHVVVRSARPSTKLHSSVTERRRQRRAAARALPMVLVILARLRMMPASASRRATSVVVEAATVATSKPAKASR